VWVKFDAPIAAYKEMAADSGKKVVPSRNYAKMVSLNALA
jgi:hypothetical protein